MLLQRLEACKDGLLVPPGQNARKAAQALGKNMGGQKVVQHKSKEEVQETAEALAFLSGQKEWFKTMDVLDVLIPGLRPAAACSNSFKQLSC